MTKYAAEVNGEEVTVDLPEGQEPTEDDFVNAYQQRRQAEQPSKTDTALQLGAGAIADLTQNPYAGYAIGAGGAAAIYGIGKKLFDYVGKEKQIEASKNAIRTIALDAGLDPEVNLAKFEHLVKVTGDVNGSFTTIYQGIDPANKAIKEQIEGANDLRAKIIEIQNDPNLTPAERDFKIAQEYAKKDVFIQKRVNLESFPKRPDGFGANPIAPPPINPIDPTGPAGAPAVNTQSPGIAPPSDPLANNPDFAAKQASVKANAPASAPIAPEASVSVQAAPAPFDELTRQDLMRQGINPEQYAKDIQTLPERVQPHPEAVQAPPSETTYFTPKPPREPSPWATIQASREMLQNPYAGDFIRRFNDALKNNFQNTIPAEEIISTFKQSNEDRLARIREELKAHPSGSEMWQELKTQESQTKQALKVINETSATGEFNKQAFAQRAPSDFPANNFPFPSKVEENAKKTKPKGVKPPTQENIAADVRQGVKNHGKDFVKNAIPVIDEAIKNRATPTQTRDYSTWSSENARIHELLESKYSPQYDEIYSKYQPIEDELSKKLSTYPRQPLKDYVRNKEEVTRQFDNLNDQKQEELGKIRSVQNAEHESMMLNHPDEYVRYYHERRMAQQDHDEKRIAQIDEKYKTLVEQEKAARKSAFVEIQIPDDGTFKIRNNPEKLQEFKSRFEKASKNLEGPTGQSSRIQTGQQSQSEVESTIKRFLREGDIENARVLAESRGIDFEKVSKGVRIPPPPSSEGGTNLSGFAGAIAPPKGFSLRNVPEYAGRALTGLGILDMALGGIPLPSELEAVRDKNAPTGMRSRSEMSEEIKKYARAANPRNWELNPDAKNFLNWLFTPSQAPAIMPDANFIP